MLPGGEEPGRFALRDARATGVLPAAHIQATLGDLATLGVSVLEGRALDARDDAERDAVVMISRSLAKGLWPGRSPVGDLVRLAGLGDTMQFRGIVGARCYGRPRQ